jgi:hypothetical protein
MSMGCLVVYSRLLDSPEVILDDVNIEGSVQAMAQDMESSRIYLDANRQGVVHCRSCGVKRLLKLDRPAHPLGGKTFKVKCGTCPRVFGVRCEWRRHYRVATQLPGKLLQRGTHHLLETITVTSLSAGGVGFVLQHPRPVYAGQHYEVAFVLADPQQTLVLEAIALTRLTSTGVGAVFFPPDKYNHDLDFYLVPTMVERPRVLRA